MKRTIELKKMQQRKEESTRLLKATIEYFLSYNGYSIEELAVKLGMSKASLYAKMKDIDKFSFLEMRKLCYILELSDDTKLKLIA